ncbi:hypothetical protein [Haloechinothrix sp. LS1_15]|uniref:hypothetical protein n=1 Tax=Haloechinothrix sp. LS1_15 TaxID=2652248 RepID=UPI0029475EFD|nr:hypothetical protein [Haloechinothrix sp. LS1_15]MDV6011142.1 hypothetical protein [Haloechinothrix sp. LS1_15]
MEAAFEALVHDAKKWEEVAEDLTGPSYSIWPLEISGPKDIMPFGMSAGLDEKYNQVRVQVQDMLNQANDYFFKLASTLRQVASDYAAGGRNFVES